MRCNFCNIKGHGIANCRHRQKEEYNNAGNQGSGTIWCKYCKCAGHSIALSKTRINKLSQGGGGNPNHNNSGANSFNTNQRRCFRCNELAHIAKYCNKKF